MTLISQADVQFVAPCLIRNEVAKRHLFVVLSTMKIRLAAICFGLFVPLVVSGETHCVEGEIDYFSCPVSTQGKVMSICGNIGEADDISINSWVQYRFGRIGRVELAYPPEKNGSPEKFEGQDFVRFGDKLLLFINGKTLYEIGVSPEEEWYDGKETVFKKRSAGITVFLSRTRYLSINCNKVDLEQYLGRLGYLTRRLREHNGPIDLKGRFFDMSYK